MILTRQGNKRRISKHILPNLPNPESIHLWVEPFFGAGGLFFSKPKSRFNILNDVDSDVYNLFHVIMTRKEELITAWLKTPLHESLWNEFREYGPLNQVESAVRFLQLSNFSFMAGRGTMLFNNKNKRQMVLERIEQTYQALMDCEFMCCDFRKVLKRIPLSDTERRRAFVYADPPYLDTAQNYEAGSFKENDSRDLFDALQAANIRFAMSEFDHPFILDQAEKRGLRVVPLVERANLLNRRMEVLICNY